MQDQLLRVYMSAPLSQSHLSYDQQGRPLRTPAHALQRQVAALIQQQTLLLAAYKLIPPPPPPYPPLGYQSDE